MSVQSKMLRYSYLQYQDTVCILQKKITIFNTIVLAFTNVTYRLFFCTFSNTLAIFI